jgi:uncharacterized integral membrane protein (TIGR00698 family)
MSDPPGVGTAAARAHRGRADWWFGVALTGALGGVGMAAAQLDWSRRLGLSGLTVAIACGIIAGNTFFPRVATHTAAGVDFSKSTLLRAGIILYGFRITFQQIAEVGWPGALIDALMVSLTFLIAVQLGTRVFRLDRQTAMLIGAGSAICGAAAVMATEPVVRAQAHKVSEAVATVVVFGTIAMFTYPLLYSHLGLSQHAFGIFAGSTIHEVAQECERGGRGHGGHRENAAGHDARAVSAAAVSQPTEPRDGKPDLRRQRQQHSHHDPLVCAAVHRCQRAEFPAAVAGRISEPSG